MLNQRIPQIFTLIRKISKGYINKKDTQEWKPPKCLISKLLSFVAGPGIEPGTS